MSATSAPFGLRPAFHPSGLDRATALANGIQAVSTSGNVSAGYASNILKGQPIKMNTAGWIEIVTGGGAFLGAFAGVEWTDATGRRRVSNYWPANESFQVGSVIAYYYSDPNIVYDIQADGSLAQSTLRVSAENWRAFSEKQAEFCQRVGPVGESMMNVIDIERDLLFPRSMDSSSDDEDEDDEEEEEIDDDES